MKLWVHELDSTGITQEVTPLENTILYAIRPHIYKHNAPAGSLVVDVLDSNGKLIGSSQAVTIASISAAAYFHGYVRFICTIPLRANVTYGIRLRGVGYTFASNAYIGWCNDYDLRKYEAAYTPNTGTAAALDVEFWGYGKANRGA